MSLFTQFKYTLKRCIEVTGANLGRHKRTPKSPQILILMYHRVLPLDDERAKNEEPGMFVTPETFKLHLNILSQYFEFIKLSDWIERKNKGLPLPAKACAITFDDGWLDNYEYAYPILQELKVPATIYLVSDMTDTKQTFWPERLSDLLTQVSANHSDQWNIPCMEWLHTSETNYTYTNTAPTQEHISEIINAVKLYSDSEINIRLDQIEDELNLSNEINKKPALLSWKQAKEMFDSGLFDIGSHTCQHIRLNAKTPRHIIENEIINSKKNIESKLKIPIKTFCYPNGDYTSEALKIVSDNYIAAVTTQSGWNTTSANNYTLQRVAVHEDISNNKSAFLSRISGWT